MNKIYRKLKENYGLSNAQSIHVCALFGLNKNTPMKQISERVLDSINNFIGKTYPSKVEVIRIIRNDINMQKEIMSYRGLRHQHHLPVRGQRTHTNAKTRRKKFNK